MPKRPTFQPCNQYIGGDVECCDGVVMDIDEFTEGWQPDAIYPPHSCNPRFCSTCGGTDDPPEAVKEAAGQDDCPDCRGGWRGRPMWPRRTPRGSLRAY